MLLASAFLSLWSAFATPPAESRPWCYWWWVNGHADRETITADLEAMKRLGFGGVLMFDSRGYWDDEEHVVNPKAELVWGGPSADDPLQSSGILGPVVFECSQDNHREPHPKGKMQ